MEQVQQEMVVSAAELELVVRTVVHAAVAMFVAMPLAPAEMLVVVPQKLVEQPVLP